MKPYPKTSLCIQYSSWQKKITFLCSSCETGFSKWMGKCSACGEWNTLLEASSKEFATAGTRLLAEIPLPSKEKIDSGMSEINLVLGGGFMKGSCLLIGREPGIGKSMLMLQIAAFVQVEGSILYLSGEGIRNVNFSSRTSP